jgi:hypothetical protein
VNITFLCFPPQPDDNPAAGQSSSDDTDPAKSPDHVVHDTPVRLASVRRSSRAVSAVN